MSTDTGALIPRIGDTAHAAVVVRGHLCRIFFENNSYLIGQILVGAEYRRLPGGRKLGRTISVKGSLAEPKINQEYEFSGRLQTNERFGGYDLCFDQYRTILPDNRQGIFNYLVDVAKWVKEPTARKIVDAFGADALRIIKESPERVADTIEGVTIERAREMADSLVLNEQVELAHMEIASLIGGVLPPSIIQKAIKRWSSTAAQRIKDNPFVLTELRGVGWASADAIHTKLGYAPDALDRHRACFHHVVTELIVKDGHTLLAMGDVLAGCNRLLGKLRDEVIAELGESDLFSCGGPMITTAALLRAEQYIAGKIAAMRAIGFARTPTAISPEGLSADQAEAVERFAGEKFFVLCGGPGTGKTYTTARIVRELASGGADIVICAPTGKAAKQITVAMAASGLTGVTATTIHSLLEAQIDEDGEFGFARDAANPLDADVIVVDETSMVDTRLCYCLFQAVRDTARILMVGDHYQLPSVGPGSVLRDLLAAGVPHFELTEIKRNSGLIVHACHAIKDGRRPEPAAQLDLDAGQNWRHLEVSSQEDIHAVIESLIRTKLPEFGADMFWEVQLLSPVNERGRLSCAAFNKVAKAILNPSPPDGRLEFGVGDKVVRLQNGRASGVEVRIDRGGEPEVIETGPVRIVNGDVGVVRLFTKRGIVVDFRYPDRTVEILRGEHHLRLAYCMTCHKLQGSECQVVVMPLHSSLSGMPLLTREWLYTAASRAKKVLITVGQLDAMRMILPRVGNQARKTSLQALIRRAMK